MKRVSITMMAAAMLFLLSACVIEPGMNSGQKVAIRFAASNGNEAGDDIVLRSAATAETETQTVSLGGDFFLYATLTPEAADAAGELRAAEPLDEGQKVYLSAYEMGTGTHVGTVLYTYTNSNLVAEGGNELVVETGKTYNFTAYSYYNNTTDTPSATNVDPAKDLIWGQHADKAITADDRTVSIVMTRRFARAKVRIGTTIPGATILAPLGAVSITSSYANLSVPDGVLTKGADITHTVTFPDNFPTDSIVGNETDTVYPGVKVNIASLILDVPGQDGTPFTRSDISLGFNSLKGGKSYVLEVSVMPRRWAWSNIYWDGEKLTFDTQDNGNQGYQGVFFIRGSLVGISPTFSYWWDYSTATPVYIPNYVEGGTSTWSAPETSPYSAWQDIPMTFYNQNTPESYLAKNGDICQYLGKTDAALEGYRLPTGNEMGSGEWITEIGVAAYELEYSGNMYADGRADLFATQQGTGYDPDQPTNGLGEKHTAYINSEMGVVLPGAGVIPFGGDGRENLLLEHRPHGVYGTSTGRVFFEGNGEAGVGVDWWVGLGQSEWDLFSVRCIRKLPGEPTPPLQASHRRAQRSPDIFPTNKDIGASPFRRSFHAPANPE
jgi:hypothetical protein